ncbi:MAG TPA: site-specific DNA-methyltransferase [Cyanobacteria bacterium UBA11149]|nr:site-specific DNA-methyltransferase [Cyanobacteria bacterium UBA11367]HBE56848.1 site-specific DNA-methyltransferase [Cyanobacteria bacterium UBA11366]HBR73839.1 site-specific DNA-methyltransferase [Cyanobacteria bacterium UBA11159]HBS71880.1 site-specific DNA-methyltransferase [Cyanobacteria bacterium UBA11153]HBW88202.1 site-specific DNA-methyltransferase [Cyanobacteria bacterium UBA11149]HCA98163.1 site-specific DNA-methyltransferase [Cyanobacteria bacterium UBA9226]
MPKKKTPKSPPQIDSLKHQDKRTNIPTEELRDFVTEAEKTPKTIRYPRDTSLDPQLVWQGKDEQDNQDLEVPAVPIYIQEKIHPHAIIEDFRTQSKKEQPVQQLSLFSDFNGLEFDQLIDFYQHKDGVKWANRMILGDSLLVMNSLAEKEGLKGKVQMIYLDPPYGIKFGSNWQVSTRKRDVKDGSSGDVTRQPEQVKAFRDTWELGIHSYLSYLRDRLVVARELLTETGSVFVQIGDENVHLVRCLMDEVFGSENVAGHITFTKTSGYYTNLLTGVADHLLWYGKSLPNIKYRQLYLEKSFKGQGSGEYRKYQLSDGREFNLQSDDEDINQILISSRLFRADNFTSQGNPDFSVKVEGRNFCAPYKTNLQGMYRLVKAGRVITRRSSLGYKRFMDDFPAYPINTLWSDTVIAGQRGEKVYVVQTLPKVIERCILMTTDPGDLVIDPTCGSGTTAYVAEQWGRRWITIDTSRVALALARTRLMSAKYPYYLLADSPEGIEKESEITGKIPPTPLTKGGEERRINKGGEELRITNQTPLTKGGEGGIKTENDIRKGFVYKRVPHITLKSIANNPEIDTIHSKWEKQLEPIRTQLNQILKKSWEEWEIPREAEAKWTEEAKDLLIKWWEKRQKRQKEIDESISRHADTEILYDQPFEDSKKLRVTGPFTVESLSPHRVLSTDEAHPHSEEAGIQQASDEFEIRIIENLSKAGIQNTIKQQRLKFDFLEPHPGTWLHATGEYTETDGTVKRVAISIGSEYGTVGSEQIKEAAKEAVKGLGYDLLIVCGFAFDSSVFEESKRYGKLQVLITRMNPDLLLGDELLKKTAAANLFMVFGEPDIEINKENGKLIVKLNGLDIYDPTTGEIRSNSTNDIACWFIDTDYNEESFFVRHAYFTGANEPYDKLKRALKADIDETAWLTLYSTISRPFDPPQTKEGKPGKIAVKVINHYGDEVLKVYEVP